MNVSDDAARAATPQRDAPLYAGIFCVSMAVLMLQIALTRIFSFTLWYHFAYVTISVALLGYGASGAFLAVFPRLAGAFPAQRLSLYALLCAAAIVVGLVVFAEVPFHPFELMASVFGAPPQAFTGDTVRAFPRAQLVYLVIFYVAVTLPFFFAGLCIAVALRARARDVSRLYFCDLVGAGFGCLVVVSAIALLTTPGAVIAAAATVGVAAVLFAVAAGRGVGRTVLAALLIAATGLAAVATVDFLPSPDKILYPFLTNHDAARVFSRHWSAIFRTDAVGLRREDDSRTRSYAGWGVSPYWKSKAATEAPKIRFIHHDGDATAVIYNFDGDLSKLELFEHLILKAPYLLVSKPNVLVIGVGGGTDIVNAIKNGARHVTGIELDPATVDLVKYDHADFAGHIYDRPDVTIIAGEGRSTLRHSRATYDLIQLTGVDTLAALSTGAYVLAESYLYTTEAMQEFLDHLTPNGVLSIVVGDLASGTGSGFPRHTIRQLSLFLTTLESRGIADPERHIAVIASAEAAPQVAMLVKKVPFTSAEREALHAFADRMGFHVWAMPGETLKTIHSAYLRTPRDQRAAFLAQFPLRLTATTDDNPFFFNFYDWGKLGQNLSQLDSRHTLATGQIVLVLLLVLAVVFSFVLVLAPLLVFARRGLRTRGKLGFIAFFLAIGLGYILIEISFVQQFVLFLGYPTYALTVVLFSLLTYSGIGSALTGRMRTPAEARFPWLFAALAAVCLVYLAVLRPLFDLFLGSPFAVRVAVATVILAPLGLPMGMFFPSGIDVVRRAQGEFVPWAWGINGCASVVATVAAVMLAMSYGFRFVTVLALACYAVGVLGIHGGARGALASADAPAARR